MNLSTFVAQAVVNLRKGQIFKINTISPEQSLAELWYEVQDNSSLNMPDNIVIAPWGDLIVVKIIQIGIDYGD